VSEQTIPSEVVTVEGALRYRPFTVRSKCSNDEKDQDRVEVKDAPSALFATVCDGATQSMRSAEAAEIISSNPAELWVDGVLTERVEVLRKRRDELLASEPSEPVDETSFLSRAFAQIVRDKQRHAFQTTLVSVRITPRATGRVLLEAKTCGDSALLVFDRRGRLVVSRPLLDSESSPFGHSSPLTEVLPDHFRSEEPSHTEEIDDDAHIVLCSDGFYDAFPNPGALFRWLLQNGADPGLALEELHAQLDRRRGDDDISYVWLFPLAIDSSTPKPPRATPDTDEVVRFLATIAAILRRLADWIARDAAAVSGGMAS
jgi:serine/threonine protein phosphatase PrpC